MEIFCLKMIYAKVIKKRFLNDMDYVCSWMFRNLQTNIPNFEYRIENLFKTCNSSVLT